MWGKFVYETLPVFQICLCEPAPDAMKLLVCLPLLAIGHLSCLSCDGNRDILLARFGKTCYVNHVRLEHQGPVARPLEVTDEFGSCNKLPAQLTRARDELFNLTSGLRPKIVTTSWIAFSSYSAKCDVSEEDGPQLRRCSLSDVGIMYSTFLK